MSKLKKRSDGLYQISVMVGEGSRKKRKYFYGHTQQEAKRKMMDYQREQETGRSFASVAEEWQKRHWPEIAAGTQTCYEPALKRALEEFGLMPIRAIAPLDVRRSLERMAGQGYAHHSAAIYLSVLHQIFDQAILMQDITVNPADTIRVPKGLAANTRQCPEDSVLQAIRDNVEHHPFGLFPYMLLYTGLRRGEILALQWRDIDFGQRLIHVSKSATYAATGNQPEIKSTKTAAGVREVVLLDRLAARLLPLRAAPEVYLFGGERPLTQSVFRSRWRAYCMDLGLWRWKEVQRTDGKHKTIVMVKEPTVTPHQLRHAYATMLFELGIPAKDAQQLLGHSKIEVTMDTYTHIRARRREDVAKKLNRAE